MSRETRKAVLPHTMLLCCGGGIPSDVIKTNVGLIALHGM